MFFISNLWNCQQDGNWKVSLLPRSSHDVPKTQPLRLDWKLVARLWIKKIIMFVSFSSNKNTENLAKNNLVLKIATVLQGSNIPAFSNWNHCSGFDEDEKWPQDLCATSLFFIKFPSAFYSLGRKDNAKTLEEATRNCFQQIQFCETKFETTLDSFDEESYLFISTFNTMMRAVMQTQRSGVVVLVIASDWIAGRTSAKGFP